MIDKDKFMAAFKKWQAQQPKTMTKEEFTAKFNEFAKSMGFDTTVGPDGITGLPAPEERKMESGAGKASLHKSTIRFDMTPKLVTVTDDVTIVPLPPSGKFTLDDIRKMIGCEWLEIVHPPGITGAVIVMDEEGKFNGKQVNRVASAMWQEGCDPGSPRSGDFVVGNVLLCHESQLADE